ncbi:MAG: hypothetical protein VX335_05205 [Pseudomonadota bacterium]|nr:hypothetical protein [Pseudomonadota bacterium]
MSYDENNNDMKNIVNLLSEAAQVGNLMKAREVLNNEYKATAKSGKSEYSRWPKRLKDCIITDEGETYLDLYDFLIIINEIKRTLDPDGKEELKKALNEILVKVIQKHIGSQHDLFKIQINVDKDVAEGTHDLVQAYKGEDIHPVGDDADLYMTYMLSCFKDQDQEVVMTLMKKLYSTDTEAELQQLFISQFNILFKSLKHENISGDLITKITAAIKNLATLSEVNLNLQQIAGFKVSLQNEKLNLPNIKIKNSINDSLNDVEKVLEKLASKNREPIFDKIRKFFADAISSVFNFLRSFFISSKKKEQSAKYFVVPEGELNTGSVLMQQLSNRPELNNASGSILLLTNGTHTLKVDLPENHLENIDQEQHDISALLQSEPELLRCLVKTNPIPNLTLAKDLYQNIINEMFKGTTSAGKSGSLLLTSSASSDNSKNDILEETIKLLAIDPNLDKLDADNYYDKLQEAILNDDIESFKLLLCSGHDNGHLVPVISGLSNGINDDNITNKCANPKIYQKLIEEVLNLVKDNKLYENSSNTVSSENLKDDGQSFEMKDVYQDKTEKLEDHYNPMKKETSKGLGKD